jgi:hypothetical protein
MSVADLILSGVLNLSGSLRLSADGGKVKVGQNEVLVVGASGKAVAPVIQPPPPSSPLDTGLDVKIITSFNQTVTVAGTPAVAQGVSQQGNGYIWPGIVLPSSSNQTVTINGTPINVRNDQAMTLPNGGSARVTTSGQ